MANLERTEFFILCTALLKRQATMEGHSVFIRMQLEEDMPVLVKSRAQLGHVFHITR